MLRIAILTYDQGAFFELGCALELFALPRPEFKSWYQCEVVSFEDAQLSYLGGVSMSVKHIDSLDNYQMLVIPSWPITKSSIHPVLSQQIRQFNEKNKRIISFCSGAFLLGHLGLLDNRDATTHWRFSEQFKQTFPKSNYIEDVLYIYDKNIGCSAGSSAAIDLGIEIIRQDFGYKIANSVARRLVLSAHRKGGQSQFADTPISKPNSQFSQAIDWSLKNIHLPIDIDQIANKANMSRRTFDRKFKSNFNISANEWIIFQRLHLAKEILENSMYDMERIAQLSGFGNATTMRHHFRKTFQISPSQHRERFKAVK